MTASLLRPSETYATAARRISDEERARRDLALSEYSARARREKDVAEFVSDAALALVLCAVLWLVMR